MRELVAAVDIGTGSARAGIFDCTGQLQGRAVASIEVRRPAPERAEQASEGIWAAAARAVRDALHMASARPESIAGLGFDATCSLVLRDRDGRPLVTAPDAPEGWDTIMWLDHRARADAAECTAASGDAGAISPEMQIPKLLWLKRYHPHGWARLGAALDLADFLTWRATGSAARSICTLGCKWGFLPRAAQPWPTAMLAALGLEDMLDRCALPRREAARVGSPAGRLTQEAAALLGLTPGTPVAAGLIDAHAGALGLLGCFSGDTAALGARRALIAGTSACIMGFRADPLRVPGLWGAYPDVVLPGYWMLEGGQSASGALLDHLCQTRSGGRPPDVERAGVFARIRELLAAEGPDLAPRLHILPDFHGNRGPRVDPDALGVVSGLDLDPSFDAFCRLFWRTCTALALGLHQILDHQAAHGWPADRLHIAGGQAREPLLVQLYADATGKPVELSVAPDPTLLGTAMATAASAGLFPDLAAACRAMHQPTTAVAPDPASAPRMQRDYGAFLALGRHRAEIEALSRAIPAQASDAPADQIKRERSAGKPVIAS